MNFIMCGRYTLLAEFKHQLEEGFELMGLEPPGPRFNISPTQRAPVIRQLDNTRQIDELRWGLIPHWAKDVTIGSRMINARSETAADKPSFRVPLRRQRCLVPASGFYEWQALEGPSAKGRKKQPYYIHRRDNGLLAFAGLWDRWQDKDGETIESFTILTTAPNELMRSLHDRMPVILGREAYDLWLDPSMQDAERLRPLLVPFPDDPLTAHPVSTRVNNVRFDDPSCIDAVA